MKSGDGLKGSPGSPRRPTLLRQLLGAALGLGATALLVTCSISMEALGSGQGTGAPGKPLGRRRTAAA